MSEFSKRLNQTRKKLLDLTKRNKLINYKRPRGKSLIIIDESPEFIYQYLVFAEKTFRFKAIPEPKKSEKYLLLVQQEEHLKNHDYPYAKEQVAKNLENFLAVYNFNFSISNSYSKLSFPIYNNLDSLKKSLLVYHEKKAKYEQRVIEIKNELELLRQQIKEIVSQKNETIEKIAKKLGLSVLKEMPEIEFIDSDVELKHRDLYLQTLHFPSELEKILHKKELASRAILQESGANMLYLILGVLEWKEKDDSSRTLKSPLITVPVTLKRGIFNKSDHVYEYTLEYNGDLITANESLSQKLKNDFNITLPTLTENMSFNNYMREVKKICTEHSEWKIRQEISLDFLQFGKILMYKDLNPHYWAEESLSKNQMLNDLFLAKANTKVTYAPHEYDIDHNSIAKNIPLVLDADSSQHSAIVDVMQGKNVVIEGPPGSGKSQIIANLIATLIADNKSVLFVSEKLVALEVVYNRLEKIGLGDFCLELHSHKTNKKKVLENLRERIDGEYLAVEEIKNHKKKLEVKKDELRIYLDVLHMTYGNTQKKIFDIFWLVESFRESEKYLKIKINNAKDLTSASYLNCIDTLVKYKSFHENYNLKTHFWRGFNLYNLDFMQIDSVIILFNKLHIQYKELNGNFQKLNLVVQDEYDEVKKFKVFKEGLPLFEELYFSYQDFDSFLLVHSTLKIYLESYKKFILFADFEEIETLDIIQSMQRSFDILTELSSLESSLKGEVEEYQEFIVKSEDEYLQFKDIEERSFIHFDTFSLERKTVDELLHITSVVNNKRGSIFRFLSSDYRKSIRDFEYILKEPLPDKNENWVVFLRDLNLYALNKENQFKLRYILKVKIDAFLRLIKNLYKSIDSTIDLYTYINDSEINNESKKSYLEDTSRLSNLDNTLYSLEQIENIYEKLSVYGTIEKEFYANEYVKFSDCILKLDAVEGNKKSLSLWNDFQKQSLSLRNLGLEAMLEHTENGKLPLEHIIENFQFNYYNSLLIDAFKAYPLLSDFSRTKHDKTIKQFRKLDLELLELNKKYVAHKASKNWMPASKGKGSVKTFTNLKLIKHEITKKTRHVPIRELVERTSDALRSLKPCFMMSPISVSQYLAPNAIKFDVLLIDEASQLRPEEALGVIARARQVVVVGDPKQLPPTSFFQMTKEEGSDDTIVDDAESILDSCIELYHPVRRLKWHYRSQHESLIDFSNQHFYDNDLMIFPSPTSMKHEEFGVKYTFIENGFYQGGANFRHNQREAERIVEFIEAQVSRFPEKSLGVGTFNSSQKELLQQLIDEREKENITLANYIEKWENKNEPFFIKNLESLQGDERDVIFISTTYGPDIERKKVMQRFGPINQENGWRRLNVMLTRAKQKMHIFTSLKFDDIKISNTSSRGIKSFRNFLKFVERGYVPKNKIEKMEGSIFANVLAKILKEKGIETAVNIGVSGYFIDLAVIADNGDFLLAIECDGEDYYAAKSASDRDRLKDEVLKRLGWKTYRIWSVEWFKNRESEIEKLLELIGELKER